ncbi:hypothetical protein [uncultured Treponema sp.]|uniref:hypothetical protein n=1 Tax=uncultured Treponema sp. TaxID=162155 RepID=UPI00258FC4FF|nr:hypothetical protein [uncultured Treponema sp.]
MNAKLIIFLKNRKNHSSFIGLQALYKLALLLDAAVKEREEGGDFLLLGKGGNVYRHSKENIISHANPVMSCAVIT